MNMAEQTEAFPRPDIPELSQACQAILKLEIKKAKILDQLKAGNADLEIRMAAARDEDKLEKDSKGDFVFVFDNAGKPKVCVIKKRDVCTFRDKAMLDKPDLEVLDGGKDDIG